MKEFRIGQRVRVVKARRYPHLFGVTGTITSALYHDGMAWVQRCELDGVKNIPLGADCGKRPTSAHSGDGR